MRIRSAALILTLLFAASSVVGVLCEMDCDPPSKLACHETSKSVGGLSVRGAHHSCDHDHSASSPALLVSNGARDSVGSSGTTSLATFTQRTALTAYLTIQSMHGPPGSSGRSVSSRTTVLRI